MLNLQLVLNTKAAALTAGGAFASGLTEEYNGSSWSEVNDLISEDIKP